MPEIGQTHLNEETGKISVYGPDPWSSPDREKDCCWFSLEAYENEFGESPPCMKT